jgi:hypothetical protein
MPYWKMLKNLVFDGGIAELVLYLTGGWQLVVLFITGVMFVLSSGMFFEKMKKYDTLRKIAGMIGVVGSVTLCVDGFAKWREHNTAVNPASIPEIHEIQEPTDPAKI